MMTLADGKPLLKSVTSRRMAEKLEGDNHLICEFAGVLMS